MVRALAAFTLVTWAAAQTPAPVSALSGKFAGSLEATDAAGNIYVLGPTNIAGLPVSADAVQSSYAGGSCFASAFGPPIVPRTYSCYDFYLAKLDPAGATVLAATYLGGQGNELPGAIAIDSQGAIYVCGSTDALTFLPLSGPPVTGQTDFVAKLSTSLNQVIYGLAAPGYRIAVDRSAIIWSVGMSYGNPRLPMLAKITPSGTVALLETVGDVDTVSTLALDPSGNPVVVGFRDRGVIVRFRASGERASASGFGGSTFITAAAAVAPNGAVYVGGTTYGGAAPGGFFTRVNPDGTAQTLAIGRSLSGLAVAPDGSAFAIGTGSAGIPTTADAILRCRSGSGINLFVVGWDGIGAAPFYATYVGPWNTPAGTIAVDASGTVSVTSLALQGAANSVTRLHPGADGGQPPCIDPLPANLASSMYFATTDPLSTPAAVAAGEYVVFYGSGIGPDTNAQWDPAGAVPLELAGVQLFVGGSPAPLLSVSTNQIIAIMPLVLSSIGAVSVEVDLGGTRAASTQIPLTAASPVVFGAGATGFLPGAVFNEDFSVNSQANPAAAGDVIAVFVSGGGGLTPAPPDGAIVTPDSLPLAQLPVTALIEGSGGQAVTFAGQAANAAAGLMQVNVRIGSDFAFHGQQALNVTFGGKGTTASFWVR